MAAIKFIKRTMALDGGSVSDPSPDAFFDGEQGAHTFIIAAMRGGEVLSLSGAVTGSFLNPNDATVPLSGSIVDGCAVVTLSNPCYELSGRFTLTIDVNGATIYECKSHIRRRSSSTLYDPSSEISVSVLIAEVNELKAEIAAAVATIPSDYSDMSADVNQLKSESESLERVLAGSMAGTILPFELVQGKYIDANGNVADSTQYFYVSTPIDISGYEMLNIITAMQYSSNAFFAFYDANDDPIPGTAYIRNIGSTITAINENVFIPTGAKYLRIGVRTSTRSVTGYTNYDLSIIGDTPMGTTAETITGAIAEHSQEISKKTNVPLDTFDEPDYGTAGQLLATDGNGSTSWVSYGTPTDQQTEEAISAWLEAHPEAVTTVQDHSLTHEKLVNGTLNIVTPEMFGAVGNGIADDTDAIQAAVNAGICVVFDSNKTYLVSIPSEQEYAISIPSNRILHGNNARIQLAANALTSYQVFVTSDSNNITFDSLNIIGDLATHTGSTGELCEGIKIIRATNIRVANCTISYCWGDGIRITGAGCKNIILSSNTIHHCGRNGLSVEDSENLLVDSCIFHDIYRTAPNASIDIEPYAANSTLKNVLISNCVSNNPTGLGYVAAITDAVNGGDVKFTNCKHSGGRSVFYNYGSGNRITIEGCCLAQVGIVQTDPNSHLIMKDTEIAVSFASSSAYSNGGIIFDFTSDRAIAPLDSITSIYNVVCDVRLIGITNAAEPIKMWMGNTPASELLKAGNRFDLDIAGNWATLGDLLLVQAIAWTDFAKRKTVITNARGYFYLTQFIMIDENSICGGNFAIGNMLERVKYSITAGDNIQSSMYLFVTDAATNYTLVYLDGTTAYIAAGDTVFLERIGSNIYVTKR